MYVLYQLCLQAEATSEAISAYVVWPVKGVTSCSHSSANSSLVSSVIVVLKSSATCSPTLDEVVIVRSDPDPCLYLGTSLAYTTSRPAAACSSANCTSMILRYEYSSYHLSMSPAAVTISSTHPSSYHHQYQASYMCHLLSVSLLASAGSPYSDHQIDARCLSST